MNAIIRCLLPAVCYPLLPARLSACAKPDPLYQEQNFAMGKLMNISPGIANDMLARTPA